jgi:4-hydroxy 2-oxovalerate aldolase
MSVNFIPSHIAVDYVFVGNRKRYDKLLDLYNKQENPPEVIATSNILEANVPVKFALNYESLLASELKISDNSAMLCLNFLRNAGVKNATIAGMDGFSNDMAKNYAESYMDMYDFSESSQFYNSEIRKFLMSTRDEITLNFITPSIFNDNKDR